MLKRFSSVILALVIGSSVMAGASRLTDQHVCQMAGMEMMPGMEAMPCCEKDKTQSVVSECCINIPQEPGSSGPTFNLRPPSFSVALEHPAVVQSVLAARKLYEYSHSTGVFSPNLQASYIRNLALLI